MGGQIQLFSSGLGYFGSLAMVILDSSSKTWKLAHDDAHAVLSSFFLAYLLVFVLFHTFVHYLMLFMPVMSLFAAVTVCSILKRLFGHGREVGNSSSHVRRDFESVKTTARQSIDQESLGT